MKWDERMFRAGLSALFVTAASMTACNSDDSGPDEPAADASNDGQATSDAIDAPDTDASADAGETQDSAGDTTDAMAPDSEASSADAEASTADAEASTADAEASAADASDANTANVDGSSPDGGEAFEGRAWVATTSFSNQVTEVATIDLSHRTVISSTGFPDTDAIPRTSDGRAFVLERTNDLLKVLDSTGATTATIALGQDGGLPQNPHDVVVIPGTSTAYVPLYNSGRVAIVDLDAATVTSTLDLSSFADASDGDHSPDIDGALYVPSTGLVYFTLQRIDTSAFPTPCPTVPSLVVAVDPRTQQLAAPDAGPSVTELTFVSPSSMVYDAPGGRLLVLSNGCQAPAADGGTVRLHHGIEAITLSTGQTQVLFAPTSPNFLSSLILLGSGSALVNSFDPDFNELWNLWDPASTSLGDALQNVPDSAVRETADTLLGVRQATGTDGGHAGYDVVRYRISTGETTVAVSNPTASPYSFVGGMAFVP